MSSGLDSKLNLLWKCYDLEEESSLKFLYFSSGGKKNKKIITIEIQHCCFDSWLLSRPVTDNEDGCDWIVFILESKTLGLLKGLTEESETLLYPCSVPWLSWPSSQSRGPAKGSWCVDTDGFYPFWWSSEFAWATQPSAGLLAPAPPGVPGWPQCQEELWKTSKTVMQVWNPMGSQEGEQGTEQPRADVQHFVLVIASGHSNSTGRMGQGTACSRVPGLPKSPEGTTWGCCQGRVYCPRGTQNTPQTDHLWMHIFHQGRLFGLKMPPSHQLLCAAGIQLLRLDLINAHMGRFVWSGRWYYWIGLSNLSVSSLTIFMNI